MANANEKKYVSDTDLKYYNNRIARVYAEKNEVEVLETKVDELITEGGEPNAIDSISVNGDAITPDGNKNIEIPIPTQVTDLSDGASYATKTYVDENGGKIDLIKVNGSTQVITDKAVDIIVPAQVSDLTDGNTVATKDYVDENGGKIDKIKVNGVEQSIVNKEVTLAVPTLTSDLINDSSFQTAQDVAAAIDASVVSVYKYKGTVATFNDLPTGATNGDVYDVQETGMNYGWNEDEERWDSLGQYVDTSLFYTKEELVAMTTAEIDAIFDEE